MEKTIDDVLFNLQDWQRFRMVVLLVGVNVFAFLYAGWGHFDWMGTISASRLDAVGALNTSLVDYGQFWRLFTSVFLHAGWIHLLVNALNMYAFGALIHRIYGTTWMWVSFVTCGLSGSLLTWALNTDRTVGASGALFGWMGMLFVLGWKHRTGLQGAGGVLLRRTLAFWTFASLIVGWMVPFIDNAAHIGGLLAGLTFGMILDPKGMD